jgi:phasin family protein
MATQNMNFSKTAQAASEGTAKALELGRGNLQAMTQSTQAYMSGMQGISRLYFAAMQGLTQQVLGSATAFAGAKTLQDMMTAQANLTRTLVEQAASEARKLQLASQKLAEEVSAPLTQHMAAAQEQVRYLRAA